MTSEQEKLKAIKQQLSTLEKENGGYTGQDIQQIADMIKRSYWYVWRRITGDQPHKEFKIYTYLGRFAGSLSPREIEILKWKGSLKTASILVSTFSTI